MLIIKKQILLLCAVLTLCSCLGNKQTQSNKADTDINKPNIIIILTDDQGYKDVGFNGSTEIPTPNIDQIANNGVVFTNGYVSYAVCGPSRAGLITGRYQDRFGFSRNPLFTPKDSLQGLPLSEETLATALSRGGYNTMAIGKWHLGAHKSQRPLNRGFNEFFGFLTGGHHYFPELLTLNDVSEVKSQYDAYKTKLLKNNDRVEEQEYLTDALSREAVHFIERNPNNPFFLYLAYNAPHTPMQATEKYLSRFQHIENKKRRTYAAMVSAVDDGVGNILNTLERLNIDENTIIFFLSDNGGPEPHNASDNGTLKDGKGSLYEGGVRVPFAMQWTAKIPKGQKYDNPIISLDIFATAIAQASITPKNKLDGVNLVPYLNKSIAAPPHEYLYWRQFDKKNVAIRSGDYKLVKADGKTNKLFNLKDDIGENHPLSDSKKLNILANKHAEWNNKNMLPLFLGLSQGKEYGKNHPDRYKNVEKY
ncbi:MAG: sulfatase-like hydrolase/transferase [Aestuariibaculum sp.]